MNKGSVLKKRFFDFRCFIEKYPFSCNKFTNFIAAFWDISGSFLVFEAHMMRFN
jgi:hypothetical protein